MKLESEIALELAPGPDNPRNSEGAFVTLSDGRILYVYTRYYGDDGEDYATARIVSRESADGGRTWSTDDKLIIDNEGRFNVMSVSLLRLHDGRIALFYLRKNGPQDCRPYLRMSRDEGQSWSRARPCIHGPGYFVLNNDRVIQLQDGRLVLPAAYHRCRDRRPKAGWAGVDTRALATFHLSDDGGRHWREATDWLALPTRSTSGLQEPGVAELPDNTLLAWARTSTGRQWQMRSSDGGETWSQPKASAFRSPCSPLSMKRMPGTERMLAVWNDHGAKDRQQTVVDGQEFKVAGWDRNPLALAVSNDGANSWGPSAILEDDPECGYCYTAIHFTDDAALLAYCCGRGAGVLETSCIRRVSLASLE